jgi:thiol-disulfide isomerase/thioredoxin
MKKIITVIALAYFVGCSPHKPPKTGLEGKLIPSVNLLLADSSSHFNTNSIPNGRYFVIFYFSPHCPYCRAQMTEMLAKSNELKDVQIYAATFGKFKNFKAFCDEFKLNQYKNITAGLDCTDSIGRYFKLKGIPFTAVYDSQKKLSQAFAGRISVNRLKAAITN